MTKRAIIVARVSTAGQDREEENGSLERQLRHLRSMASDFGFSVVAEERNAASGAKEESPHFQKVTDLVESHGASVIMFATPDRFARNVLVGLKYLYKWMDMGVEVYIGGDRVDMNDSCKALMTIILLAAAQFQRDKNAEGSYAKHVYASKEGRWYRKTPPLGYDLEEY